MDVHIGKLTIAALAVKTTSNHAENTVMIMIDITLNNISEYLKNFMNGVIIR